MITDVTEGTVPPGSMWVKNPVPLVSGDDGLPEPGKGIPCFRPHCEDIQKCSHMGDATQGTLEIVDYLRIPEDLEPGNYVLGWCACTLPACTVTPSTGCELSRAFCFFRRGAHCPFVDEYFATTNDICDGACLRSFVRRWDCKSSASLL